MSVITEIAELIKTSSDVKLKKHKIYTFLLENNAFQEESIYSENDHYQFANGKRTSLAIRDTIIKKKDPNNWDLSLLIQKKPLEDYFNINEFSASLNVLHTKHLPNIKIPNDYQTCLRNLVFHHFFNTPNPTNLLQTYTIKKHYEVPKQIDILKHSLSEKNIFILAGLPGIGKEYLVNAYLQDSTVYQEVVWFNAPQYFRTDNKNIPSPKLSECFHNIPFQYANNYSAYEKQSILQKKPSSTIIVIRIDFLSENDYEYLKQFFFNHEIRIILITTSSVPQTYINQFSNYHLTKLDDNILHAILTKDISSELFPLKHEDEFKDLYKLLDNNILALSLVNATIKKKPTALTSTSLLNESKWLWRSRTLDEIETDYFKIYENTKKSRPYKITTFLSWILDILLSNKIYKPKELSHLFYLSIFASSETGIPEELLKEIIPEFDLSILQNFVNSNLLALYTSEHNKYTYYRMSPLIAQIICYQYRDEVYTILDEVKFYIDNYLTFGCNLIIPQYELCDIAYALVQRISQNIMYIPRRNIKEWKKPYNEWNNLLLQILYFARNTSFIDIAHEISEKHLFYYHPRISKTLKTESESWLLLESLRQIQDSAFLLFADFSPENVKFFENSLNQQKSKIIEYIKYPLARIEYFNSVSWTIESSLNMFFSILIRNNNYSFFYSKENLIEKLLIYYEDINVKFPATGNDLAYKYTYYKFLMECIHAYHTITNFDFSVFGSTSNFMNPVFSHLQIAHNFYLKILGSEVHNQYHDLTLRTKIYAAYFNFKIFTYYYEKLPKVDDNCVHSLRNQTLQNYLHLHNEYFGKLWSHDTDYAFNTLVTELFPICNYFAEEKPVQ